MISRATLVVDHRPAGIGWAVVLSDCGHVLRIARYIDQLFLSKRGYKDRVSWKKFTSNSTRLCYRVGLNTTRGGGELQGTPRHRAEQSGYGWLESGSQVFCME